MKRISEEEIKDIMSRNSYHPIEMQGKLVAHAQLRADKETVKEIFEEIEKKSTRVTGSLVKPYRFINEDEWQALVEKLTTVKEGVKWRKAKLAKR